MKNCEHYQKHIEAYIEGELTQADNQRLREHIQDCPACRDEYLQAQTLAKVLEESFQPRVSDRKASDSVLESISQHSLQPQRTQSFFTFGKIAAGIMVAAALLISFYAGRASNQWRPENLILSAYTVQKIEGTVLVKHANSQTWQPLTANSTIYTDDQFISSPNSSVIFSVDEQSYLVLKENSMLILDIMPDKTNLHLVHGTLDADLGSPHGPFFVTTPHGQAEALGTEFTVKVD